MDKYQLYWNDLAFGSKKPLRELNAVFIAAPRELSTKRLTQLIKQYLPTSNIILGCAEEDFIDGFEGQLQFKTLRLADVDDIIDKVNASKSPHKMTVLHYRQRDAVAIYEKVAFRQVVLVNGSWQYSFHTRSEYYTLVSRAIPFTFVSPFADEDEAQAYAARIQPPLLPYKYGAALSEVAMLEVASIAATGSFDSAFQTGASLGKRRSNGTYELLAMSYNKVVPYQTFAWHYGASRERHLSAPGDLNHYDAVHAETMLLIQAQKDGLDLRDTTLFINLLPCPFCARMLCETDIDEFVYSLDHSSGYAATLLERAGKTVRRVININDIV